MNNFSIKLVSLIMRGRSAGQLVVIFLFIQLSSGPEALSQAPSEAENFIRTEHIRVSGVTTDQGVIGLASDQKVTTYQYMDGLGRILQGLTVQGSPQKKDIVSFSYYDIFGRPVRGYLPYRVDNNTGAFRSSAQGEQGAFYSAPPVGIPQESAAYSVATFEESPLGRVLSSTRVGSEFQSTSSMVRQKVNDASAVRRWTVVSGLPQSQTTYPAGSLLIEESTDEAGAMTRAYKDFRGLTVLTQVQGGTNTWFDTYYVYNDYSELLFVIPPTATTNLTPNQSFADQWFFQYEYDELGRQTGSKSPGSGWYFSIYDRWDRVVLTQRPEQRTKAVPEWDFVKYDLFNRPVMMGTFASSSTRQALAASVASSHVRDEQRVTTNSIGYTLNRTFPAAITEASLTSIQYYDDYSFLSISSWSSNNSLFNYVAETGYTGVQVTGVKGLLTGSKARTEGVNSVWLHSVTYYDKYYQPLQAISSHQYGGTLRTITQYAFDGCVEKTLNKYTYTGGSTNIARRFVYDHMGRLMKLFHKVDNDDEVMLSDVLFNELGQAYASKHHSRDNGITWLYQEINEYASQGWLRRKRYEFSDGTNVFTQDLGYQNSLGSGNTPRFDGLISGNKWQHGDLGAEVAYNYSFDISKRLTGSVFRQKSIGTWASNNLYNENGLQYDANGNITALTRNGNVSGVATQVDNLSYTYTGNTLTAVSDNAPAASKAQGFNDGNTVGNDYSYNTEGALVSDKNKGISTISYNRLQRPERIDFNNGSNIRYSYSASGALLSTTYHSTVNGAATRTEEQVGELLFENGQLKDINHEFGRVVVGSPKKYQYYLTDYLGSTRVVLQEDPAVFSSMATFEPMAYTAESEEFLQYDDASLVTSTLLNHTPELGSQHAIRLNGQPGEQMGPARCISVMPGDTIRMCVYAKYLGKETIDKLALLGTALQFAGAPASAAVDGLASGGTSNTQGSLASLLGSKNHMNGAPPAYLSYLFFDHQMRFKDGGFVQMSDVARENGSDVQHEKLSAEYIATEPGFVYVYISNEEPAGEAYFDDFEVQTSQSYIVQTIDYYPYGQIGQTFQRAGERYTKDLFQGKTYEDLTKWYDFHARQYDGALGRFLGIDPQGQFPSPYVGMGNNPILMVDPDGEFAFVPVIVGAVIGAYMGGTIANEGQMNPGKWDYSSGRTWGYMGAGAIVGGLSGGLAHGVATSGIPFANTAAIMTGSAVNSLGTYMYTGGQTDLSIAFGVASYNFSQNEWGYLGKKGNSAIQNIGYGLGALANLQDAFAGINGAVANVKARKEIAGHSWIEGNGINISVGPAVDNKPHLDGVKWESQYLFKTVKGRNFITGYKPEDTFSTTLNNVNVSKLQRMTNNLNRGLSLSGNQSLNYGVWNGCVNQTSRALFRAGVFNVNAILPITSPVLLNAELALRNYGMMFSYYMTSYR